ncbi:MAG TPA: twin-arginine translocase subunit TatC [Candidatus Saccharimonadales bacterium]
MSLATSKRLPTSQKPNISSGPELAFAEHIRELRRRLIWVVAIFLIASSVAYNYHIWLTDVVLAPIDHKRLIYLTPTGGFNFIFQVTMYAGLILTVPMLVYQLYGFVRPALPSHSRKTVVKIMLASVFLLALGVGFGYFVAVPSSLKFLSDFAAGVITASLTADSYLAFLAGYLLGLGILFQLPLLLLFWNWINPLTPGGLLKSERYVILLSFVAAAIITPTPDIANQAMIALPIIVMYQFGVLAVLWSIRRKRKEAAALKTRTKKPVLATTPQLASPDPLPQAPLAPQRQQPALMSDISVQLPRQVNGPIIRKPSPLQVTSRQSPTGLRPQRGMNIDGIIS